MNAYCNKPISNFQSNLFDTTTYELFNLHLITAVDHHRVATNAATHGQFLEPRVEARARGRGGFLHLPLPPRPGTIGVARVDEMEHGDEYEETLATLLEVSRTPEGRASLSDELRDILYLLPVSPSRLLLLRLRLLRNLLAGDELNQITFIHFSGPSVVVSSVLSFPTVAPDAARAALQALGNAALAGEYHRAAIWEALFPGALREFAGIKDAGVLDPLCMVLDTCCSGEGGRGRLEELCHGELGLPILVEVITTASKGTFGAILFT